MIDEVQMQTKMLQSAKQGWRFSSVVSECAKSALDGIEYRAAFLDNMYGECR